MDGETKFLVPADVLVKRGCKRHVIEPFFCLPLGSLTSPNIRSGLFCFLAESSSAVGVLFANGFPVWQVLCTVDNDNEGTNDGTVEAHVGKDARRMRSGDGVRLHHFGKRILEMSQGESGVQVQVLLLLLADR